MNDDKAPLIVKATDKCRNCGDEFANHNYVPESLTVYKCRWPHVEHGYGFFCGGDPRKFYPDGEDCTAEELSNHRKARLLWDEAEARGEIPTPEACPSGWVYDESGKPIAHVLRTPYGIGGYSFEYEQYWEPSEPSEYEPDEEDYE
jgi:hypothetical protein